MLKNKALLNVLRWILILPSSIVAAALARGFLGFWLYFHERSELLFVYLFYETVLDGFCGAFFVYVAAYIAPSGKRKTAFLFAFLFSVASGIIIYAQIMINEYWSIIPMCGGVVGSIVAVLSVDDLTDVGNDIPCFYNHPANEKQKADEDKILDELGITQEELDKKIWEELMPGEQYPNDMV